MDQQPVARGIEGRYAGVVPLEVEIGRRDNAFEVLERGLRVAAQGVAIDVAPGPLERRPLTQLAGQLAGDFGRILGYLRGSSRDLLRRCGGGKPGTRGGTSDEAAAAQRHGGLWGTPQSSSTAPITAPRRQR